MKVLPADMLDALRGPCTTVCNAWIITRSDGQKLGLTDHDHPLTVEAVLCDPAAGADRSNLEATLGANSDVANLAGILSSEKISETDVISGRFDEARLEHFIVDWRNPETVARLRTYKIGEITRQDDHFRVELRGVAGLLARPNGRLYARSCAAQFCDAECGLVEHDFTHQGMLVDRPSPKTLQIDPVPGIDAARLLHGVVRVEEDGTLASIEGTIDAVIPLANAINLTCHGLEAVSVTLPSPVTLIEGCDRQFATCRDQFANAANFRGFPHLPGNHQILNYIDEETRHDGAPIVP